MTDRAPRSSWSTRSGRRPGGSRVGFALPLPHLIRNEFEEGTAVSGLKLFLRQLGPAATATEGVLPVLWDWLWVPSDVGLRCGN